MSWVYDGNWKGIPIHALHTIFADLKDKGHQRKLEFYAPPEAGDPQRNTAFKTALQDMLDKLRALCATSPKPAVYPVRIINTTAQFTEAYLGINGISLDDWQVHDIRPVLAVKTALDRIRYWYTPSDIVGLSYMDNHPGRVRYDVYDEANASSAWANQEIYGTTWHDTLSEISPKWGASGITLYQYRDWVPGVGYHSQIGCIDGFDLSFGRFTKVLMKALRSAHSPSGDSFFINGADYGYQSAGISAPYYELTGADLTREFHVTQQMAPSVGGGINNTLGDVSIQLWGWADWGTL